MSETSTKSLTLTQDVAGLAVFVGACLAVSGFGGAITATSVDTWYQALEKPPYNPPDWVFAPVWLTLYLLMGVSGWRVWRRARWSGGRTALTVFAAQLVVNLGWSFLFFGLRQIGLALIEVAILLLVIVLNGVLFWRIDRLAGLLFVPYVLWVAYAAVLNAALWQLN